MKLNDQEHKEFVKAWVKAHTKTEILIRLDRWAVEMVQISGPVWLEQAALSWLRGEAHPHGYRKLLKADLPKFIFKHVNRVMFEYFFVQNKGKK